MRMITTDKFLCGCRQFRYCRSQTETDPGSDMDAHSALLHFDASLGRRGGSATETGADAEAATSWLDPRKASGQTGRKLYHGLERR